MTPDQMAARAELAKYGFIVDPKYTADPDKAEEKLKATVKACWKYRKDFPSWIETYIAKWSKS